MPVIVTEGMLRAGYDKLEELAPTIGLFGEDEVKRDIAEVFRVMFEAMPEPAEKE